MQAFLKKIKRKM